MGWNSIIVINRCERDMSRKIFPTTFRFQRSYIRIHTQVTFADHLVNYWKTIKVAHFIIASGTASRKYLLFVLNQYAPEPHHRENSQGQVNSFTMSTKIDPS
jgi:hypothetical protein